MLKKVYINLQFLTFLALLAVALMRDLITTATQCGRKHSAGDIMPYGEIVSPTEQHYYFKKRDYE